MRNVGLKTVCFMCLALTVAVATGTTNAHAQTGPVAAVTRCDVSVSGLTLENACSPPLTERGVLESGTVDEVHQRHLDQGYIPLPAPLLTYGLLFDTHVPLQLLPPADEVRLGQLLEERVAEGCKFIARPDSLVTGRFAFICPSSTIQPAGARDIPLFTSASVGQQGFARIINRSDTPGTVDIHGIDDSGDRYGPITLSLGALSTAHFNSQDLEAGNSLKGLSGGLGDGDGSWRLELDTELDIEVSAYIRTIDGFLTSMHDVARTLDPDGLRHHVPIFNPGSNEFQRSQLRLINLGADSVSVTVEGRDDKGDAAPGGEVRLTLADGEARLLSVQELESGGAGFIGKLGDGAGKWQLFVTADGPIQVMSLLQSPTGHLTNLSVSGLRFTASVDVPTGETFRDTLSSGGKGPEMVVIPAGSFRMGCLNDDGDCSNEFPVHDVDVPRFALSKYEVTFAQWDACVAAGGCGGYRPPDEGWGRGDRPVIWVSWDDARSYAAWLSSQTGEDYRLPSESEWEYAARAGTTTKYHWGDQIGVNQANCQSHYCGDMFQHTAPVGSFPANAWGLHDMHGNIWEWVEDCWHGNYQGAPTDGSAWTSEGNCSVHRRVVRGGSWGLDPGDLRSAYRNWGPAGHRNITFGFRVARTLTP